MGKGNQFMSKGCQSACTSSCSHLSFIWTTGYTHWASPLLPPFIQKKMIRYGWCWRLRQPVRREEQVLFRCFWSSSSITSVFGCSAWSRWEFDLPLPSSMVNAIQAHIWPHKISKRLALASFRLDGCLEQNPG